MKKMFNFSGEKAVLFLYTKRTFHWNELNYSIFHTIFFLTDFIGKSGAFFSNDLYTAESILDQMSKDQIFMYVN